MYVMYGIIIHNDHTMGIDSIKWKKLWEQLLLHEVIEGIPISCPLDKADIKKPNNSQL